MSSHELKQSFLTVDTTAICDGDEATRVVDSAIRLRSAQARMIGPAFTVRCRDDLLGILRAVESASPGDVIVVDGGGRELAFAGELVARGAIARGLAGIVVDGGYRDMAYIVGCELPVYSRSVTPRVATASKLGELQVPVTCGGATINPGDFVLADEEGMIVVAPDRLAAALDAASDIKAVEAKVIAKLSNGGTLTDGFNLDEHVRALTCGEPSRLRYLP